MNNKKKLIAFILTVSVCLSVLFSVNVGATSASGEITYRYGTQGYVYNWGVREETAVSLSTMAELFYLVHDTSYEDLTYFPGGTNELDAPDSVLYLALSNLMRGAHTNINDYGEVRYICDYTDCQNSGGKISSFYSGREVGPGWTYPEWNREHTWPNSKGLGGADEDDIMMVRPTAMNENSARGNLAYGKSAGYYNPNSESNGEHDLRGDVARIFLYVYVRWGNTQNAWGTTGVMESPAVMLEWMEADPVDTWELGRNDSVESITGTRNVFVDYPELAFMLFGEEIPEDMETPSSIAKSVAEDVDDIETEEMSWFERLIQSIIDFFMNLFGISEKK